MRKAYDRYLLNIEKNLTERPADFCKFVRNKSGVSAVPLPLSYNGCTSSAPKEGCDAFGDYFCSVYNNRGHVVSNFSTDKNVSLKSICVTVSDLEKALHNLKTGKGAGSEDTPPLFYKICSQALLWPLLMLFNLFLKVGWFPSA